MALLTLAHGGCGAEAYIHDHAAVSPPLWVTLSWWSFEPSIVLALAASAGLYLYGLGDLRRHLGERFQPGAKPWLFFGGLGLFAAALLSPLDALANYLLSAHILQHFLLSVLAPPLLLLGVPRQLLLLALRRQWMRRALSALTQPVFTWVLYHAVLGLWLLPGPYQAALASDSLHVLQHLSLTASGLAFWWVVVSPLPSVRHLGYSLRLLYLLLASVFHLFYALPLALADQVLYPVYLTVPRLWGTTPTGDQALAAVLMGAMDFAYWLAVILVFFAWTAPREEPAAASLGEEPQRR